MNRTWVRYCLPLCFLAAGCADRPPDGDAVESKAGELVTITDVGRLMPFGGRRSSSGQTFRCVSMDQGRLKVFFCGDGLHPQQVFTFSNDRIRTAINPDRCAVIQGGNLTAGIVTDAPCSSTDNNQKWVVREGRIVSGRTGPTPGFQPYCLDVRFNSQVIGAELGVAPCNDTEAQAFFVTGFTTRMRSYFNVSTGPDTCDWECLDVRFDNEHAGAELDNFNCNGTNAQWLVPYDDNTIRLANSQTLCIGLNGATQPNGVTPVALQNCNATNESQRWYYELLPNGGTHVRNLSQNLCLDITLASATPGTAIVAYACNNQSNAQRWNPLRNVPCVLPN